MHERVPATGRPTVTGTTTSLSGTNEVCNSLPRTPLAKFAASLARPGNSRSSPHSAAHTAFGRPPARAAQTALHRRPLQASSPAPPPATSFQPGAVRHHRALPVRCRQTMPSPPPPPTLSLPNSPNPSPRNLYSFNSGLCFQPDIAARFCSPLPAERCPAPPLPWPPS